MSRAAEYILAWSETRHRYELSSSSTHELLHVMPDGAEWFTWLSHVSSFAFRGKQYALTARCEHTQRGNTYWYRYSRVRKKVRKKYLGRTVDLCSERLEQVANLLHLEDNDEAASNNFDTDRSEEQVVQPYKRSPTQRKKVLLAPLLTTKLCIPCLPVHLVLRTIVQNLHHTSCISSNSILYFM